MAWAAASNVTANRVMSGMSVKSPMPTTEDFMTESWEKARLAKYGTVKNLDSSLPIDSPGTSLAAASPAAFDNTRPTSQTQHEKLSRIDDVSELKASSGPSDPRHQCTQPTEKVDVGVVWRHVHVVTRWLRLVLDPDAHIPMARFIQHVFLCNVLISCVLFVVETLPGYYDPHDHCELDDTFFVMETLVVMGFTLEFIARSASCQLWSTFFGDYMTWIDLCSVLTHWIHVGVCQLMDRHGTEIFRGMRIIRIFRLARYTGGMTVVTQTFRSSGDILLLLVFLCSILTVIFASFMFFAEQGQYDTIDERWENSHGQASPFDSIPKSFYWCMVTLSTLGFGDFVPQTMTGKILASACMICGVVMIAMPISILGRNFTTIWETHMMDRGALADDTVDRTLFRVGMSRTKIKDVRQLGPEVEKQLAKLKKLTVDMCVLQKEMGLMTEDALWKYQRFQAMAKLLYTTLELPEKDGLQGELEEVYDAWARSHEHAK